MNSTFRLDGCTANHSLNSDRRQIRDNNTHFGNQYTGNQHVGKLRCRNLSLTAAEEPLYQQALGLLKRRFSEPAIKNTEHQLLKQHHLESHKGLSNSHNHLSAAITKSNTPSEPEPTFQWFDQQGQLSCEQTLHLLNKLYPSYQHLMQQGNLKLATPLESLQKLTNKITSSSDTHLSQTEVETLYQLLDFISKTLQKGELQELTKLLAVQTRLQGLLKTRETLKEQLYQQLKKFEQPGASSQINLFLQVSAGAGLFGLNLMNSKLALNLGFQILTDDDSGLLEIHTGGMKLGIQVGNKKILEGFTSIAGDAGVVYSDGCLADFVNRYTDNLMGTLLTAAISKSVSHLKGWNQKKTFQQIQQQALTSQHRLNNLLLKTGIVSHVETHTAPPKVVPGKCKLLQSQLSAGVKLFHRIFQGSYQKSQLNMDILSRQPLLDSVKQDSSRVFRYDHRYYTPSINRMAELRLQQGDALPLPERAKQVIDELAAEFQHYSQLVQFCDYAKQHPKQINKQQLRQAQQVKASFEVNRGVKGRAEFTKAVTIAYGALHQLCQASASDEQKNQYLSDLSQFEATLKRPSFHMAEKNFIDKLSFNIRSMLKRTYEGGTLQVSLPAEHAALGLHITHLNTKEHPNYYRKGQYLDVVVDLKGQLALSDLLTLFASERAAFSSLKDILQANNSQANLTAEGVTGQLRDALNNVGDIGFDAKTSLHFRLKQIESKKQWALQFVRLGTHSSFAVSTPEANIPVLPGVNSGISGKIKTSQTTIRKEWLGNNTLSYMLPIHNTLQGAGQSQRWQQLMEKHEKAFKSLFINMAKANTTANQEMTELLAEIDNEDLQTRLKLALSDFAQNKIPMNYQQAVAVFNEFLSAQLEVYKVKSLNECWDA